MQKKAEKQKLEETKHLIKTLKFELEDFRLLVNQDFQKLDEKISETL